MSQVPIVISPTDRVKRLDHQPPSWRPWIGLSGGYGRAVFGLRLGNAVSSLSRRRASGAAQYRPLPLRSSPEIPWRSRSSTLWSRAFCAYFPAWSYSFRRRRQISITVLGVFADFLAKTSAITIASASMRYTRRHWPDASLIRNSWHRGPTVGMGLDCGIVSMSPRWRRLSKYPVSSRAARENGGVLTSPCSQASGLSLLLTAGSICQNGHRSNGHLTIVGGVREAQECCRGHGKRVCARGSNEALLCGPSTSPLDGSSMALWPNDGV